MDIETNKVAEDQYLIDLELASARSRRRLEIDPDEFGLRAAAAVLEAKYVDGRAVLRLALASLLRNPGSKGKNSGQARLARIMAILFDEKTRPGRPRRPKGEVLTYIAECVLKGRQESIMALSAEAVEEVIGVADEALAKAAADEFSTNRSEILADYVESRYPHSERRVARLIVDLFAACGLEADPLITAPITTDPYLGREVTADQLEEEYEARNEAAARRD